MNRSRTLVSSLALASVLAGLGAGLVTGLAACTSGAQPRPVTGGGGVPLVVSPVVAPKILAATRSGAVEFLAYDGPRAADPRLAALRNRLAASVAPAVAAAEERAGVTFLPGRDAAVILADDGAEFGGEVTVRLLDGVRRPMIRVPVADLLSGVFVPEVHFPVLVVEAAVVASAGDRTVPSWLRAGLGVELGGAFERILHERALGGAEVRTDPTALFPPTPSGDDRLRAAARIRALDRIARGDRPLARFVVMRLEGRSEPEALAEVGVQDGLFLDAAAETERDRALDDLAGLGLDELAATRLALAAGEPARAIAPASVLETDLREGRLGRFVAADVRVALAHFLEEQGDAAGARLMIAPAIGDPAHLVRVRDARLVEARAAVAAGAARDAARLFRSYASDFPGAPGSDEALLALGVPPELAEAVPGIAAEIASDDPRVRQRATIRLGETGDPLAAEPLRELTRDDDATVRRLAFAALALAVGEDSVADLERGTRDSDAEVRGASLSLLAFADPAKGEARAGELADDAAPAVRSVVERVLRPAREAEARRTAALADAAREREQAAAEAERERLRAVADEARRKAAREAESRLAAERLNAQTPQPPQPPPPQPEVRRPDVPRPDASRPEVPRPEVPRPVPPRPVGPDAKPLPPPPPRPAPGSDDGSGSRSRPLPPPVPDRPKPVIDQPDPTRKPPPPVPVREDDPARRKPPPPAPSRGDDDRP